MPTTNLQQPLIPQQTVKYKTYVKQALVEGLTPVFEIHTDDILRKTFIGIDFSEEEVVYPSIIIRFYERSLTNAGVGHTEWRETVEGSGLYHLYKHYLYTGDIEFAIYALSSYDRDLVADALIQTLAMGDLEAYTNQFFIRIYQADPLIEPTSVEHYVNLNTDEIMGFGESQVLAPWEPEDTLVYQTSYRINIHGEFYSLTPDMQAYGLVERVDSYPYDPDAGEEAPEPHPDDPAPWEDAL